MELLNNYLFKDMFKLSSLKIKSTFQVDVIDVIFNFEISLKNIEAKSPFDTLIKFNHFK